MDYYNRWKNSISLLKNYTDRLYNEYLNEKCPTLLEIQFLEEVCSNLEDMIKTDKIMKGD